MVGLKLVTRPIAFRRRGRKFVGVCMFRIRKARNGEVTLSLSGRIEVNDLVEIQQQMTQEATMGSVVLDLKDVTLVNEGVVEFLVRCEANNISLRGCPSYIRQWMEQLKEATMSVKR